MTLEITDVDVPGYVRVARGIDPDAGLSAFISIHNTSLGPGLGGLRMLPYGSEAEALEDANRLARAMTYKAAVAETGQGGGKAVIMGHPRDKTPELLHAMGRFVDAMEGQYIIAEDMNITVADLETIAEETRWVSGLPRARGSSGDPSPFTAEGCLLGMQACAQHRFGDASLEGRTVCIQGVGAVGGTLARFCVESGAKVAVCDIDPARLTATATETGALVLNAPDACFDYPCDILAPCARGGVLDEVTVPMLGCAIVAGAANNQIASPEAAERLRTSGILYAPDFVINAGGIINIACEFAPEGYSEDAARKRLGSIPSALERIFAMAEQENTTTAEAAERLAEERLRAVRR